MFSYFFKKSNKRLESYFKNQSTDVDVFKEHYNNFKPTLDQIKSYDNKTLHKVESTRDFVMSDLKNLFSTTENRNDYILSFKNPSLIETTEYSNLLSKFEYNQNEFNQFKEYFCDENNLESIRQVFLQSRIYSNNVSKHPDMCTCLDKLFKQLELLTNSELQILSNLVNSYEQYSLVVLEPYLVTTLGAGVFLNIVIPLHKSGTFAMIVNKVVNKHLNIRNTISSYLSSNSMKPMYRFVLKRSNVIMSFGLMMLNLYNLTKSNLIQDNSTTVTNLVNKYIDEAKKLEDPFTQTTSFIFKKTGFVMGYMVNSLTQGVLLGLSSKNSDSIIVAAKKVDGILDTR